MPGFHSWLIQFIDWNKCAKSCPVRGEVWTLCLRENAGNVGMSCSWSRKQGSWNHDLQHWSQKCLGSFFQLELKHDMKWKQHKENSNIPLFKNVPCQAHYSDEINSSRKKKKQSYEFSQCITLPLPKYKYSCFSGKPIYKVRFGGRMCNALHKLLDTGVSNQGAVSTDKESCDVVNKAYLC